MRQFPAARFTVTIRRVVAKQKELSPTLQAPMVDERCTYRRCEHGDTYRMAGDCRNCNTAPVVGLFSTGHEATSGFGSPNCPVCGVRGKIYWTCLEDLWPR